MSNLLVLSIALASVVSAQNFCENREPVDTIFTIGEFTYARKKNLFYRTKVGQPFDNTESLTQDRIFPTHGKPEFVSIDSGFMVTKTPDCSPMEDLNRMICEVMKTKIKGKGFIVGKTKSGAQEYKTYNFDAKGDPIPVTNAEELPFGMKPYGPTIGDFWPKQMSKDVQILHSTFDERNDNLVLIINDKNGKLNLYYYDLKDMKPTPEFTSVQDIQSLNEDIWMKGFFHMPTGRDNTPMNVFGIATERNKDSKTEIVVELNTDKGFDEFSTMTLTDIYNCEGRPNNKPDPEPNKPQNTRTTTTKAKENEPILEETTGNANSETPIPGDSETGKPMPAVEISTQTNGIDISTTNGSEYESEDHSVGNTLVWILLIVFTIGIILFVILISIYTYVKLQKPKHKTKGVPKQSPE